MEQTRCRSLAAFATPKRCVKQRDFKMFDLFIEVGAPFRQQDLLLRGIALGEQVRRKMTCQYLFASNGHDQALNQVLQFANVAGPAMLFKHLHGVRSDPLQRNIVGATVNLQEMLAQHSDIARAVAQRGQLYWHHVDSVKEVLAEASRAHHLLQRFVGRADQAKVDLPQSSSAEALYLMIFENAQKLGLQRQGQGSNFIEEECALVRQFDLSRTRFGSAGKGAFLAAKQLRFNQVLWKRRAVKPNVWLLRAAAQCDNCKSEQLLANSLFTANQYIDPTVSDLLDCIVDSPHGFACADEVLEAAAIAGLPLQRFANLRFFAEPQRLDQRKPDLGEIDRTSEVCFRTGFKRLLLDRSCAGPAERNHNEALVKSAEFVYFGETDLRF